MSNSRVLILGLLIFSTMCFLSQAVRGVGEASPSSSASPSPSPNFFVEKTMGTCVTVAKGRIATPFLSGASADDCDAFADLRDQFHHSKVQSEIDALAAQMKPFTDSIYSREIDKDGTFHPTVQETKRLCAVDFKAVTFGADLAEEGYQNADDFNGDQMYCQKDSKTGKYFHWIYFRCKRCPLQ